MSIPAGATPRPWALTELAGIYGSVVSRDPEALSRDIELRGEDHVRAYGGVLVGESISPADRELIVHAVNEYEVLLELVAAARWVQEIWIKSDPDHRTAEERALDNALARLDHLRSSE